MPSNVRQTAARDKANIRLYNVIYELIDDARDELSKLLAPEVIETNTGRLVVRAIFKTTKTEGICGGEVTKGKLVAPAFARVVRGEDTLGEIEVTMLKRGPQETKEVLEGEMCGLSYKTSHKLDLQDGDRIEVFRRETLERTL
jgi:translation initiation factor IF-2